MEMRRGICGCGEGLKVVLPNVKLHRLGDVELSPFSVLRTRLLEWSKKRKIKQKQEMNRDSGGGPEDNIIIIVTLCSPDF